MVMERKKRGKEEQQNQINLSNKSNDPEVYK